MISTGYNWYLNMGGREIEQCLWCKHDEYCSGEGCQGQEVDE